METIHLIGSEAVHDASINIQQGASEMQRAANRMEDALRDFRAFLDDWLNRLENVLAEDRCKRGM